MMAVRSQFAVMLVVGVVSVAFSATGFGACPESPDHFTFVENTGCTYSIVINDATIGGVTLEAGDEVGVFDGDVCVGAVCWSTPPVGLTAWCDDTQTTPVDGYVCGNPMSFKFWDSSVGDYCEPAVPTYTQGNGNFCDGFAAILTLACEGEPQPECSVDPPSLTFNVGTIGGSDDQTFTITNTGGGTLAGSVTESCDEFTVSPGSYSLGAGEFETFTVTYTPTDCGDDQCTVDTDLPCVDVECTATGPNTPVCEVDPTELAFSVDTIGGSDIKTFTITNIGCGQLMGDVTELCDEFGVTPEVYNLGPGEFETFTVTYMPGDCGDDQCTIDTDEACTDVVCTATGPNTPICEVSPTDLSFNVDTIGGTDSKTFTITNVGCGQLTGSLFADCPEFEVYPTVRGLVPNGYSLGPGESIEFTVDYTPQDCGDDQCEIDTDVPCANVMCTATGPGCPDCAVDPTNLSFNVPAVGGSDSRTFTITNVGGGTLAGTVTESCDEFTVAPGSYNLGPGEFATFTVTYTPADCGDDQCTIDTDLPCVDVTCDATGPVQTCDVDPTELTFSVETLGYSDSKTFRVSNTGCGQLVGEVGESCAEFSVDPPTLYDLDPGEYQDFTVTYTPVDVGDDMCTLELDLPCEDVACTATGPECVPTHFTYDTNTDQTYEVTINTATIGGRPLAFGDEVGVFVGPTCVGAVCWGEPPVTLTAWINDDQCGLLMRFKVWDTKWERAFPARARYYAGDRLLCTMPLPVVRLSVYYDLAGGGLRGRPNPLNPDTEIAYSLPGEEPRYTSLKIFNPLGQLVRVLVDEVQPVGEHVVRWDGNNSGGIRVSSGVYFAVLRAGEIHDIEKLMVVK